MSTVFPSAGANTSGLQNENAIDGVKEMHCNTGDLMGPLGLLVQAVLAFLAFTSLIGNLLV